jgi:hypothetical protein
VNVFFKVASELTNLSDFNLKEVPCLEEIVLVPRYDSRLYVRGRGSQRRYISMGVLDASPIFFSPQHSSQIQKVKGILTELQFRRTRQVVRRLEGQNGS